LPVLEALAFGNWVIGGGPWLKDFIDVVGTADDGGPIAELPARKAPIKPVADCRGYEIGQQWWEVSQVDLLEAMRTAHEALWECGPVSYEERQRVAQRVREAYGPTAIGSIIRERLEVADEALQGSGW
jgi:hypothetical protein